MLSPPIAAASWNISACSRQASSQVGCRLMVASSAKISRPRSPGATGGARLRARCTNASISGRDEVGVGARPAGAGVLLDGSFAISRRTVASNNARQYKYKWPFAQPAQCPSGPGDLQPNPPGLTGPGCAGMAHRAARAFREHLPQFATIDFDQVTRRCTEAATRKKTDAVPLAGWRLTRR